VLQQGHRQSRSAAHEQLIFLRTHATGNKINTIAARRTVEQQRKKEHLQYER
jgi:hypothetical protein